MPTLKYKETCNCCKHEMVAYTLPLNRGLVEGFVRFSKKYLELKRPLKKNEMDLTNSQYTNFHNLRHFGIVKQETKGREWSLTPLGMKFLQGEVPLLNPAGFMGGETLPDDHKAWNTLVGERSPVFIESDLAINYKDMPQYQQEKFWA